MKKKAVAVFFLLLNFSLVHSQRYNDGCGSRAPTFHSFEKQPWYGNNEYLSAILDSSGYFNSRFDYQNALFRVPLKLWIYRTRQGKGGITPREIKQLIYDLNYYNLINNTGFLYYLGEIEYIDKTRLRELGYYLDAPWQNLIRRTPWAIDVHIAENIIIKHLSPKKGRYTLRGTYNKLTQSVTIKRHSSPTTLAHEIGHFFGLLHPHENWQKGKLRQEAVSRTRRHKGIFKKGLICEHSGDALCDTPAEPDLTQVTDDSCNYKGTLRDNWGDLYKPNTQNIMSYPSNLLCRNKFTPQQVAVMVHTAREKNICAWDANCLGSFDYKKQYNFDIYEPDDDIKMSGRIHFGQKQYHSFHTIYNGKNKPDKNQDTDWLRFDVENFADSVVIETFAADNKHPDTQIFVYDRRGNLLAQNDNKAYSSFSKIFFTKLSHGAYFIKITKKAHITKPDIADYFIRLSKAKK